MSLITGIHPVLEALRAGQTVEHVCIAKGAAGPRIQEIIDTCRTVGIPVRFQERKTLEKLAKGTVHQGVIAVRSSYRYADFEQVVQGASMLVVLDGVVDPHNLGAIVRTGYGAGANAVVIPERRAAHLTEAAVKAAAGALEYLPVAKVTNISRTLEMLKRRGFWIYGLDERGEHRYDQIDYALPTAFVLGSEGRGLRRQTSEHCDFLVRIPLSGKISSLNVSVAAGIVLFEWRRRKS
jgi:23S rRNA (guanosine2251-2'-O)-methyltransferase